MPETRSWPLKWVIPLLAATYFVAGKLGLMLAFVHANATAVWPPTGIALAAVLLLGYRVWPAIFAGAFLVNLTTPEGAFYGNVTSLPVLATTLGIALGNTLEGLAGAWLINHLANGRRAFKRAHEVILFAGLAGFVSTTLGATAGVLSLCLGGLAPWANYGAIWLTWWLGDAGGALLVAPLIVLWVENRQVHWSRRHWLEAGCLGLVLMLIGAGVFAGFLHLSSQNFPPSFLSIPVLMWAALRFGPRETATASFLLCGLATWGTLRGHGPFARMAGNESLVLLQAFMGINSVMALAVAALVAERGRALQALRASEERLDFALQMSHTGGWDLDLVDHTAYRTLEHDRIFGYGSLLPQWTYEMFLEHVLPEDRAEVDRCFRVATATQAEWNVDCRIRRVDGEVRWIWAAGEHRRDEAGQTRRMTGIVQDITERKQTEAKLLGSLREKEVLLKEVHHRVKNNLQIVSSLLNLQWSGSKNPELLEVLKENQSRIKSMALVHEHLYLSRNLAEIDFAGFIRDLTANLFRAFNVPGAPVTLKLDLEPVRVGADTAIPCALIIHELVSNALKHAFPGGRAGEILVTLHPGPTGQTILTVRDNGVSLPPELDFRHTDSLGLQLVNTLTRQIRGTLELDREGGTRVTVSFPSHDPKGKVCV